VALGTQWHWGQTQWHWGQVKYGSDIRRQSQAKGADQRGTGRMWCVSLRLRTPLGRGQNSGRNRKRKAPINVSCLAQSSPAIPTFDLSPMARLNINRDRQTSIGTGRMWCVSLRLLTQLGMGQTSGRNPRCDRSLPIPTCWARWPEKRRAIDFAMGTEDEWQMQAFQEVVSASVSGGRLCLYFSEVLTRKSRSSSKSFSVLIAALFNSHGNR
jgi:hypothetical protein